MRFFTTLFLFSLLTISIFAQQNGGSISGQIVENSNSVASAKILKENIQNKTVTLMSKNDNKVVAETTTDKDGNFSFDSVQSGDYWIFVDCDYCLRNSVREEISVSSGQTLKLKIELPKFTIYEKVEISAGTSQPFDEISKSVSVIDSKELRERSESFLGDSLRTVPAFRVQQSGGFGRFTSIKIRGLRNQDTAILLDGMRFRDASAISGDASSFISDFTHTNAFRMEILRGSGSSLYGTNAIGGVVDVQTQAPRKGFHGGLTTAIGSLEQKRIRGNISDGFDKFGYTFGVSRTIFSKGIDGNDDAHNTNFNGRFDFTPTQKTQFSGRIFVSDAFVKLNSSPDTFGTLPSNTATIIDAKRGVNFVVDADDPDAQQKSNAFNGQIRFTHFFKDNLWFSSNYQGSRTQRRNSDGLLGVGFQSEYDSIFGGQIHTFENKLNWQTERNFLTVGYEYEWERFLNRGISRVAIENFQTVAKQSSNTFYAQDLLNFFNRKLQLLGSFRTQIFNLQTPTFSTNSPFQNVTITNPPNSYTFDGSASYFVEKSNTKIRFHAGNGYRVPSLYERFGSFYSTFGGAGFTRIGNPNLKPEKSFAFDFGIDQILAKNRVKLSATYFYTKINDVVSFISSSTSENGYINLSNAFSRGAEFSAEIKPFSTTNIFASYTFTNSDQRGFTNNFLPPLNLRSVDRKSFGIPDHQFSIVATQYIGKRFFVNFDFLATSNYLAPIFSNSTFRTYTYRFQGNRKADFSTSYEIPSFKEKLKWRFFGTVENIFGNEYFENGFQTAGRTFKAGLSISF